MLEFSNIIRRTSLVVQWLKFCPFIVGCTASTPGQETKIPHATQWPVYIHTHTHTYIYPLEEEMTTHSSVLAWRIPWTEEPWGLQSMGIAESDKLKQLNTAHTYIYI